MLYNSILYNYRVFDRHALSIRDKNYFYVI